MTIYIPLTSLGSASGRWGRFQQMTAVPWNSHLEHFGYLAKNLETKLRNKSP